MSQAVMGGWSSEWEYEYEQMSLPTLEKENNKWCILFTPQVKLSDIGVGYKIIMEYTLLQGVRNKPGT